MEHGAYCNCPECTGICQDDYECAGGIGRYASTGQELVSEVEGTTRWYQVGDRVCILYGDLSGQFGEIYDYLPYYPHPWHVRPDGWSSDLPGIALTEHEMRLQ